MTTVNAAKIVVPQLEEAAQEADRAGQETQEIGGNLVAAWRFWRTWTPGNGTWDLQIPLNVINPNSTVVITAAQVDGNGNRFVGPAPIDVLNTAPGNGVVTFKINIGSGVPIPMRTDVLVFN
ncbi:hypothetical protein [Streptomyces silvensis]|uniref:Uncharacterized protein n=1 Tax=Streptomyces silvensis TaxID=1765722 RepID=A0A0W7X9L0_9ACTN|nr:hypothetical protein [Streptomyces silvensis]KUF19451.1 hypothetical protein AT728_03410 [Streptomyces silvensis]